MEDWVNRVSAERNLSSDFVVRMDPLLLSVLAGAKEPLPEVDPVDISHIPAELVSLFLPFTTRV